MCNLLQSKGKGDRDIDWHGIDRGPNRHEVRTKTKAFYDNLLNPGTSYRVTIDRWILRGLELRESGGGNGYVALYRGLEELFRQAALKEGLRPCELQAAVWCAIQDTAQAESWEGSRPGTGTDKEEEPPF